MWKSNENVKKVFPTDGRLCKKDCQRVEFECISFVCNDQRKVTRLNVAGNSMLSEIAVNRTAFRRRYIASLITRFLTENRIFQSPRLHYSLGLSLAFSYLSN